MAPVNNLERQAARRIAAAGSIKYTEAIRRLRASGVQPSQILDGTVDAASIRNAPTETGTVFVDEAHHLPLLTESQIDALARQGRSPSAASLDAMKARFLPQYASDLGDIADPWIEGFEDDRIHVFLKDPSVSMAAAEELLKIILETQGNPAISLLGMPGSGKSIMVAAVGQAASAIPDVRVFAASGHFPTSVAGLPEFLRLAQSAQQTALVLLDDASSFASAASTDPNAELGRAVAEQLILRGHPAAAVLAVSHLPLAGETSDSDRVFMGWQHMTLPVAVDPEITAAGARSDAGHTPLYVPAKGEARLLGNALAALTRMPSPQGRATAEGHGYKVTAEPVEVASSGNSGEADGERKQGSWLTLDTDLPRMIADRAAVGEPVTIFTRTPEENRLDGARVVRTGSGHWGQALDACREIETAWQTVADSGVQPGPVTVVSDDSDLESPESLSEDDLEARGEVLVFLGRWARRKGMTVLSSATLPDEDEPLPAAVPPSFTLGTDAGSGAPLRAVLAGQVWEHTAVCGDEDATTAELLRIAVELADQGVAVTVFSGNPEQTWPWQARVVHTGPGNWADARTAARQIEAERVALLAGPVGAGTEAPVPVVVLVDSAAMSAHPGDAGEDEAADMSAVLSLWVQWVRKGRFTGLTMVTAMEFGATRSLKDMAWVLVPDAGQVPWSGWPEQGRAVRDRRGGVRALREGRTPVFYDAEAPADGPVRAPWTLVTGKPGIGSSLGRRAGGAPGEDEPLSAAAPPSFTLGHNLPGGVALRAVLSGQAWEHTAVIGQRATTTAELVRIAAELAGQGVPVTVFSGSPEHTWPEGVRVILTGTGRWPEARTAAEEMEAERLAVLDRSLAARVQAPEPLVILVDAASMNGMSAVDQGEADEDLLRISGLCFQWLRKGRITDWTMVQAMDPDAQRELKDMAWVLVPDAAQVSWSGWPQEGRVLRNRHGMIHSVHP